MNRHQIEVARLAESQGMKVVYYDDTQVMQVWKNGFPIAAIQGDGTLEEYRDLNHLPGVDKAITKLHRINNSVEEYLSLFEDADDMAQDSCCSIFAAVLVKSGDLYFLGEDKGLFDAFAFTSFRVGRSSESTPLGNIDRPSSTFWSCPARRGRRLYAGIYQFKIRPGIRAPHAEGAKF